MMDVLVDKYDLFGGKPLHELILIYYELNP